MRIAILHYHLRAGGVGRVIDLAAQALTEEGHQLAVIAGSAAHARSLLDRSRIGVVPDLDYTRQCGDVVALGKAVDVAAREILGGKPDLWHFHNSTLGKNPMVSLLAAFWAREGRALVLQLHDFAEQERPANYQVLLAAAQSAGVRLGEFLYPMHARVRYAVLTIHDAALLAAAGLKSSAVVLPNPVQPLPMGSPFPASAMNAEEYIVYPTRAIARKNVGEALLWSAHMKPGQKLVITLAPEDSAARAEHDLWEEFAIRHDLPVVFDSVTRFGRPLGDFIAGSRAAMTTSIREGFGMAYLEPWLLGTPVVGRNLSKVTVDFLSEKLSFDWLYSAIPVALTAEESTLHAAMCRQQWKEKAAGYGVVPPESTLSNRVDFGQLHAPLQRRLLERCLKTGFNSVALPDLQVERAAAHVSHHQEILTKRFGPQQYAQKLVSLYRQALEGGGDHGPVSGSSDCLDPEALLALFLRN